jgi:hypothetical protein
MFLIAVNIFSSIEKRLHNSTEVNGLIFQLLTTFLWLISKSINWFCDH